MDKSLTYLNKEVKELRGTVEDKDKQIEYLHTQQLYLEWYSKRENLKFFGIPENEASASEGKDAVGTIDVLISAEIISSCKLSLVSQKSKRLCTTGVF